MLSSSVVAVAVVGQRTYREARRPIYNVFPEVEVEAAGIASTRESQPRCDVGIDLEVSHYFVS
ncbi:hypothetical protein L195_g024657 [Trifolium pratense]|uniref:Uncharacterized protein n=1 Tax=Trifolium pratense TaxID=57577 RepID=A0A2K3NEA1_TRIPR|nr:hypothetical protein L195_g024657 [Trifolium pratense]